MKETVAGSLSPIVYSNFPELIILGIGPWEIIDGCSFYNFLASINMLISVCCTLASKQNLITIFFYVIALAFNSS